MASNSNIISKMPVFFISHGGPPLSEWRHHSAYKALQNFGKVITDLNPKGLIVFSAHWAGSRNSVYINEAEDNDLIYDFYGFPKHYYQMKFPTKGSKDLALEIQSLLKDSGIESSTTKRGLDHGIWVPFKIAFDEETNSLKVPLVQVSIYGNEDPTKHLELGKSISSLREKGYVIITSGSSIHNLRDIDFEDSKPYDYAISFDKALTEGVTKGVGDERETNMLNLLKRKDARKAHPTFEHILPVYIALGAAKDGKGSLLYNLVESSLGWSQFKLD